VQTYLTISVTIKNFGFATSPSHWRARPYPWWDVPVVLGFVFAPFITLPYGKFVHGTYRFVALVRASGR
jgi:hypothetical protein